MRRKERVPLTEVPRRLSISYLRAWQLLLAGKLDGAKDGGRWYVTTASVDAYAAAQNNRPAA